MDQLTCTENVRLVSFLYELMRDHVPPGIVEGIIQRDEKCDIGNQELSLCNGYLGAYAQDLAGRLEPRPVTAKERIIREKAADNPYLLAGGNRGSRD